MITDPAAGVRCSARLGGPAYTAATAGTNSERAAEATLSRAYRRMAPGALREGARLRAASARQPTSEARASPAPQEPRPIQNRHPRPARLQGAQPCGPEV